MIMVMEDQLVELMAMTKPKIYQRYITINKKGKPVLYVKLQKVLYDLLKSTLLFYKKLLGDLMAIGFTPNPYDMCIVNKTVEG